MQSIRFSAAYRVDPGQQMPPGTQPDTELFRQRQVAQRLLEEKRAQGLEAELHQLSPEGSSTRFWYVLTNEGPLKALSAHRVLEMLKATRQINARVGELGRRTAQPLQDAISKATRVMQKTLAQAEPTPEA